MQRMAPKIRWPGQIAIALSAILVSLAAPAQDFSVQRAQMIRAIEQDVRRTSEYLKRSALDERVLAAMARVPRHAFVPPEQADDAYLNRPLPIGDQQTISQPYIVAIMTDLLEIEPGDRVLEIGTGSAYQAAVLADLGARTFSIEIIEPLAAAARERLLRLGYPVELRVGDGYHGWPEEAPFDAIIVTAAASHVPPPLIGQLKPGGKMVIPVGGRFMTQLLLLLEKGDDGEIVTRQIGAVRFVPLTGEH